MFKQVEGTPLSELLKILDKKIIYRFVRKVDLLAIYVKMQLRQPRVIERDVAEWQSMGRLIKTFTALNYSIFYAGSTSWRPVPLKDLNDLARWSSDLFIINPSRM